MKMKRENELIIDGSPCDINYFNKNILTIEQTQEKGPEYCQNLEVCKRSEIPCVLRYGLEVTKYVIKGSVLKQEIIGFSEQMAEYLNYEFWDSENGIEFLKIKGKAKILKAVERFARIVLLQDPNKSDFSLCDKCNGIKLEKTVMDSIHDGFIPLAGSGRTKSRTEEYCPDCDPEPRGEIINQNPID